MQEFLAAKMNQWWVYYGPYAVDFGPKYTLLLISWTVQQEWYTEELGSKISELIILKENAWDVAEKITTLIAEKVGYKHE